MSPFNLQLPSFNGYYCLYAPTLMMNILLTLPFSGAHKHRTVLAGLKRKSCQILSKTWRPFLRLHWSGIKACKGGLKWTHVPLSCRVKVGQYDLKTSMNGKPSKHNIWNFCFNFLTLQHQNQNMWKMSISTPFAKPCSFENQNDVVENYVAENHMTAKYGWQW